MPAAVHNLKLRELSAAALRLRIVDAAQCPIDVSSWAFEASLRPIESQELIALLKVNLDNPSAGEISIAIPPRERSIAGWLLSAAPQGEELKPLCHGVATFAPSVSPKDTNNPETHRLILALADPVRVSVDSVDLAFWAASQAQKAAAQTQDLADSHFNEADIHATADEKAAWNAKLSPADADARYGLAGTIPGQEVAGQSFSTSFYWRGTHAFCKSANFETGELENFSMLIDVDSRYISFLDSVIYSSGIATFNTLEANRFYCNGTINGSFSGNLTGNSTGTHTGDVVFADRLFNEFNLPGFRVNPTEQTVSFNGTRVAGGVAKTNPLTIHYAPEEQKVDVANLVVKGQTVLNPSSENDEVLLATFKANNAARYELRLRQSDGALRLTFPGGGSSIFSCNGSGKMFALRGFDVKGDFTAQSATFSGGVVVAGILNASEDACVQGRVQANKGIYALPLGKKTALGADAYGLSVSADGGLQLWGTHFLQGSIWGENGLKMVQNEVSLTSTDSAAIGFDYANTVDFRTMPNDGDGHGVYRFQCWKWTDDSHTAIEEGAVDVRKKAAMQPSDESLLNRAENDSRYGQLAGGNLWSGSNVFSLAPVVGVASGGTEAMSLQGWAYLKAKYEFKDMVVYSRYYAHKTQVREEVWKTESKTINGEVLLRTAWVNNSVFDVILMQKAVAGSDYCYIDTGASPHTVTQYLGVPDYGHERCCLHQWVLSYNLRDASVAFGGENYLHSGAGDIESRKGHAIHWTHQDKVVNTRYPRLHEINTQTETAWHYNAYNYHLTFYGDQYLGSEKSALIRATDFYCEDGRVGSYRKYAKFKWALMPVSERVIFSVAPINRESSKETHYLTKNVLMLSSGNKAYRVLDMYGAGNGNNGIRAYRLVMKRHKGLSSGQYGVGLSFAGMEVYGQPGEASASKTLGRVVNEMCEDYLPMPEVAADKLEIPAEGGQVVLTVAPTGHNANIYCLNDTMDGSGTFEVWCTQDKEELPSSGGQITLSIAPNTTGEDRELWVFVGHHWAEATKVELVQKGA